MKSLICFYFLVAILFISACQPAGDKPATGDHVKANTISPLKDTIDVETAKRLIKNFDPRTFKKPDVGFFDTRCVWFSIEQLGGLIEKIKSENGDGVRFYLAAYDENSTPYNFKPDYRDHSTLIMVSTKDSVIFINDPQKRDTLHVDYFYNHGKGVILTTTPENQGELCPPPNPCTSVGAKLF